MKTYEEQKKEYENLNKFSERLRKLKTIDDENFKHKCMYKYTVEGLEERIERIKDYIPLKDVKAKLEDALKEAIIKENEYKQSIVKFESEFAYLLTDIQTKIDKEKRTIIIKLDGNCAKEANLPQVIKYKGYKKDWQSFFEKLQCTWNYYCTKNLNKEPQGFGYRQVGEALDLDYLQIAEDANKVLEFLQKNI